jgi:hypothetical protein
MLLSEYRDNSGSKEIMKERKKKEKEIRNQLMSAPHHVLKKIKR